MESSTKRVVTFQAAFKNIGDLIADDNFIAFLVRRGGTDHAEEVCLIENVKEI
jgi:hypothetical protein